MGGTKTAIMAVECGSGRTLTSQRFATPDDLDPAAFVARLHDSASDMLAHIGCDVDRVRAVGCAVPGQVDTKGAIIAAGNLGWRDVPLRELFEQRWQVPVFVEQDGNAGALGEMWCGAARSLQNFVFLALGTGIGAGIVLDGRIHRGAHHAAGEAGDLIAEARAASGQRNLADRLGSRALRRRLRTEFRVQLEPGEAIAGSQADPRFRQFAKDVANDLAVAVIAIAVLIDPEAIIFGGGTAAGGEELIARVRERVQHQLWVEPALILAGRGEDAQLYGAVVGAMTKIDSKLDSGAAATLALQRRKYV